MSLPAKKQFKCEILSWRAVAGDAKKLSRMIQDSAYNPHIVVAIGRGGLVPARILCDYMHIKDLTTIKVEHWGIAATPDEKAVIKFPLNADIKDKKVLLVDDITDTGDTLRVSIEYLKGFKPKGIRTAVLLHKTSSDVIPDYYVKKIAKWRWIIFPWHVWEDLTSFIKKIKECGIYSIKDIRRELKNRYCIDITIETIREILSEVKQ
ncbi:MAG: phosphoribosyltransferase [Thermodesulfovibrionales bacterium]